MQMKQSLMDKIKLAQWGVQAMTRETLFFALAPIVTLLWRDKSCMRCYVKPDQSVNNITFWLVIKFRRKISLDDDSC